MQPHAGGTELEDASGPVMFFLLRLAFWFGLVLFFLPFGEQTAGDTILTASQTRDAVQELAELCERQPAICASGIATARLVVLSADEMAKDTAETADQPPEETGIEITGAIPLPTPRPRNPLE